MKFQKSSLIVLLSISFLSKHTFAFFDLADDDFCQKNPNDAICTIGLDKSIKKVIDETGLGKNVLKPLEDTLEKLTNSNPVDNTNPDSDKKADKDKLIERQAKEIERLNALIQKEKAAQEVAEPSKSEPIAATNVPTNNINTSSFPTKANNISTKTTYNTKPTLNTATPKIDQTIKPIQTTAAVTEWAKEIIKKPVSDFKDSFPKELSYDKGKYETTSEYQQRVNSTWSNKHLYFDVALDTKRNTYDADTGNYRVVIDFTDTIYHLSDSDFDDNSAKKFWGDAKKSNLEGMRYYLQVGSEHFDLGEYVASNSFGAEVKVSSTYHKLFKVYFSNLLNFINSTSMPANKISEREPDSTYRNTSYAFNKDFSIPRSEIRNLEKNLKLRIVVREPTSDFDFVEDHTRFTPTIDVPKDISGTEYYMRSKLIGFILYNGANGDILSAYKL